MALSISTRVVKLEARRGGGPPRCPECGGGDDDGRGEARAEVQWFGLDEDLPEPESCPTCGESIEIVVWED